MEFNQVNNIPSDNITYLSPLNYIPNRIENFNKKFNISPEDQKYNFLMNRVNHGLNLRKEKIFTYLAEKRGYLEKLSEDKNNLNLNNENQSGSKIYHLFYINQKCREYLENKLYDSNLIEEINISLKQSSSNSLDFEDFNFVFFFLIEFLTSENLLNNLQSNNHDKYENTHEILEIFKNLNILINISSFALDDYINSEEGVLIIEKLYPIIKILFNLHEKTSFEPQQMTNLDKIKLEMITFISNVVSSCESNLHEQFIEECIISYRDSFLLSHEVFKNQLSLNILFLFSNLTSKKFYIFREIDLLNLTMQIIEKSGSGKVLNRCFCVTKEIISQNKSELQRIYFHYKFLMEKIVKILDKIKTEKFVLGNNFPMLLAHALSLLQQFISDSSVRQHLLGEYRDIKNNILESLIFDLSNDFFIRSEIIHTLLLLIEDSPESVISFNEENINRLIDIFIECSTSGDLNNYRSLNDLISIFHSILKDEKSECASILYCNGLIENILDLIENESNKLGKSNILNQLLKIFYKLLIFDKIFENSMQLSILLEKKELENIFSRIYNHNPNIHIKNSADKILKIIDSIKNEEIKTYI
jgi:hypothetical protein